MNKYNRNDKLRIYYDAEFTGLNRKTGLISVGLVSDNGTAFYSEFTDFPQDQVTEWINDNIIRHLIIGKGKGPKGHMFVNKTPVSEESPLYNFEIKGRTDMVQPKILEWLLNEATVSNKQIQFFTDCYAYDWVLMNDLICDFGDALNIPKHINYIPIDLSTLLWTLGIDPDINREEFVGPSMTFTGMAQNKHNSLWDAYVIKACFEKILSNTKVEFN